MNKTPYLLTSLFFLSGCANQIAQSYTPFTVEVVSKETFTNDLTACRGYASAYLSGKSGIDPSQVAQEGARAGFSDLGYSAISPTAPALGALGGVSGEIVSELGLNSQEAKKVVTICLHDKGQSSGQYHVYDPLY